MDRRLAPPELWPLVTCQTPMKLTGRGKEGPANPFSHDEMPQPWLGKAEGEAGWGSWVGRWAVWIPSQGGSGSRDCARLQVPAQPTISSGFTHKHKPRGESLGPVRWQRWSVKPAAQASPRAGLQLCWPHACGARPGAGAGQEWRV